MFAPRVSNPKTTAAANSTNGLVAHPRSTLTAQRHGPVEQALLLQRNIGNQATLRHLAQRTASPTSKVALFPTDRMSRSQASSSLPRIVQPKLVVGEVDDPLEHEADRVADRVMRMPDPALAVSAGTSRISRKCEACEEEQLQAKPAGGSLSGSASATRGLHNPLGATGQPLDAATRQFFEPRFCRSFADVRIHADAPAHSSARQLGAHAYTIGRDIAFAAGRYAPHTPEGRRLLAHELTHVAQQSGGTRGADYGVLRRQPADPQSHATPGGGAATRAQVPYEKWSPQIEEQYRKRGDTPRANAVRDCREIGGEFCDRLLTLEEVNALYGVAQNAKGDEGKVRLGLGSLSTIGILGYVSAGAVSETTAATTTAATTTAAGGGAAGGAGAAALAGPAAIVAICAIAGYQLWKLGQFEEALRQQGFIILEDPLGICIGGCHLPSQPATPAIPLFDQPGDRFRLKPIPGPGPLSDADRRVLEDWLTPPVAARPRPAPAPQPAPQTTTKPVMPPGLSIDERRRWKECEELYETYKQTQSSVGSISGKIDPILDDLANNRPVTDQQRIDLCEWLEQMLRLIERLHQGRNRYIEAGCDRFDWFNQGGSEAERRRRHEAERDAVDRQIKNRREQFLKFCRPGGKKSP